MKLAQTFKFVADALRGPKAVLREALRCDDWETATRILQKHDGAMGWEYKTDYGLEKPLHLAASSGAFQILSIMLHPQSKPYPVDTRDNAGRTALMNAMLYGHETVAKLLLARGADIHASDGGRSVLCCAISSAHLPMVELALAKGANLNEPDLAKQAPLETAASGSSTLNILKFLLDKGADPNGRHGGLATLLSCLSQPNPDGVRMLLNNGTTIDLSDTERCTQLLNWSVWAKQPGITTMLLERGLDPLLTDKDGKSAHELARLDTATLALIDAHLARKETERKARVIEEEIGKMNAGLSDAVTVKTLKLRRPNMSA